MTIALAILLALTVGVGGTAYAADNARPGDLLFGVDRAVERVRLSLSTDEESKNELRIRFVEERLAEVESLSEEDESDDDSDDSTATSTDEDGRGQSNRAHVETGLALAIEILEDVSDKIDNETAREKLAEVIAKLNTRLENLPEDSQSNVRARIDVRMDTEDDDQKSRVRVRIDDGRIRIEAHDDDDDGIDSDDSRSGDDSDHVRGLTEAEAKIFTDMTVVKLELNDQETSFTTTATTREEIIGAILSRVDGITTAEVEAVLEVEVEDRASRTDDTSDDSDNNEKDDDKNDDEKDNSGSGKDDDDDVKVRVDTRIDFEDDDEDGRADTSDSGSDDNDGDNNSGSGN